MSLNKYHLVVGGSKTGVGSICEYSTKIRLQGLYCVYCRTRHGSHTFVCAFMLTEFGAELASQLKKRPVEKGYCCSKYYQKILRKFKSLQQEIHDGEKEVETTLDTEESSSLEPPTKIAKINNYKEEIIDDNRTMVATPTKIVTIHETSHRASRTSSNACCIRENIELSTTSPSAATLLDINLSEYLHHHIEEE